MSKIKNKCDFCNKPAIYDGKTKMGPWAYMCSEHFEQYGVKLKSLYTELGQSADVPHKVCRVCKRTLPLTEFYKYTDNTGTLRYRTECIDCNLRMRAKKQE